MSPASTTKANRKGASVCGSTTAPAPLRDLGARSRAGTHRREPIDRDLVEPDLAFALLGRLGLKAYGADPVSRV